jgi:hypothetical protein
MEIDIGSNIGITEQGSNAGTVGYQFCSAHSLTPDKWTVLWSKEYGQRLIQSCGISTTNIQWFIPLGLGEATQFCGRDTCASQDRFVRRAKVYQKSLEEFTTDLGGPIAQRINLAKFTCLSNQAINAFLAVAKPGDVSELRQRHKQPLCSSSTPERVESWT